MKRKIIITEFYPARGHANLFANTFRLLGQNFDTLAITTCDNEKVSGENCIKIPFGYYKKKENYVIDFFSFLFYSYRLLKAIRRIAKENQISDVICLTYDEVSLFLLTPLVPSSLRVYLMSHVNIDNYANSNVKNWMFRRIKNRYNHIVQCGFMADYFEANYQLKNVLVWPHPLNRITLQSVPRDIDCAGLSFSNDENVISHLIEMENKEQPFKRHKLKVVVKSQQYQYDNGFLTVIKGRLSSTEYDNVLNRAKSILMPFPSSFKMRMSGTLIDSLTNKKIVIASPITVINESNKIYPNAIKIFNEKTFVDDLCSLSLSSENMSDFDSFIHFHSDENLADIMFSNLSSSLKNENVVNTYDF